MNRPLKPLLKILLAGMLGTALAACGAGRADPTPTQSIGMIQTEAVSTFAAGLTQTSLALPTQTASGTPTSTATPTPTRGTPLVPGGAGAPTASCYNLTGVMDVTIPDNTAMVPGQVFTKTWRVRNTGTCAWQAGFRFTFTSGNAMGGTALLLDQALSPGAEIDFSVDMVAPVDKTGSVRGNWRLATAAGLLFGDEQYVIIVIGGATGTATLTHTPISSTATFTPEPTETE